MLFKITAKKKLDELLAALNLSSTTENIIPKEIDVSRMNVDYTSKSASEMIKAKLSTAFPAARSKEVCRYDYQT